MLNYEMTIHPALQHVELTTGNLPALVEWYPQDLGIKLVCQSDNPTVAGEGELNVKTRRLSNG